MLVWNPIHNRAHSELISWKDMGAVGEPIAILIIEGGFDGPRTEG